MAEIARLKQTAGIYDSETNLPSGVPTTVALVGDQRPGDNLYTSSVIAFDATSGAIKSHFQRRRKNAC